MARSVASDRFVKLALRGAEGAIQRAFVASARAQIDRVKRDNAPTATVVYVDGRQGAALEAVRPFGTILAEFSYLGHVAEAAIRILRETSPVDEGEYQDTHSIYVDGAMVSDHTAIGEARRFVVTNDLPYARVIEIGIGRLVPWSKQPQVPREGVYKAAAAALRREFRHVADIGFTWVGVDGGAMLGGAAASASKNRYPALVVETRQ